MARRCVVLLFHVTAIGEGLEEALDRVLGEKSVGMLQVDLEASITMFRHSLCVGKNLTQDSEPWSSCRDEGRADRSSKFGTAS